MARKTITVVLTDAGRDTGKRFIVTEKPARVAHEWAQRALFAAMNAGIEIPENAQDSGMAGIAAIGLNALGRIPAEIGIPLANDLLTCVDITPNPSNPDIRLPLTPEVIDGNIEEASTLFRLQKEALLLHMGFSTPASP